MKAFISSSSCTFLLWQIFISKKLHINFPVYDINPNLLWITYLSPCSPSILKPALLAQRWDLKHSLVKYFKTFFNTTISENSWSLWQSILSLCSLLSAGVPTCVYCGVGCTRISATLEAIHTLTPFIWMRCCLCVGHSWAWVVSVQAYR